MRERFYRLGYKNKDAQNEYQRKWVAQRRAEFIAEMGGVCCECGDDRNLEIDHKDRLTKISHRIWSWAKARIREELKKCQLLCETCHIEKTKLEREYPDPMHGTNTMYTSYKCRCQPCRDAHAIVNARYVQ